MVNGEPHNEPRDPRRDSPRAAPSHAHHASPSTRAQRRRVVTLASALAVCAGLFLTSAVFPRDAALSAEAVAEPAPAAPAASFEPQDGSFTKFPHQTGAHAALACDSCHRRENNSAQPTMPGGNSHAACINCHQQQFFSPSHPMCTICHTDLGSSNPPVKAFPRLASFNVKFDHAQHLRGAARPSAGCASCHAPMRRGVALSIPAGLGAHNNCYQCHTPGANSGGRDIGSCGACHNLGGYRRTPTTARAYAVSFSHATHGPRQGLRCDECHSVRAGAAQSRQVTSPTPSQHFASARAQSCMTCHNNRRTFGGDDFDDCKRCHKGATFRF